MYTTQKQVKADFWNAHPKLSHRKIANFAGDGKMYTTDTRCAFVEFLDYLCRDGQISDRMANSIKL